MSLPRAAGGSQGKGGVKLSGLDQDLPWRAVESRASQGPTTKSSYQTGEGTKSKGRLAAPWLVPRNAVQASGRAGHLSLHLRDPSEGNRTLLGEWAEPS